MQISNLKIPLMKPYVGSEELEEIRKVLESGYLAQGPKVKEFETSFANYLGVKNAVATTSCTTALELALRALDIKANDEVIVPDFTFPATGNVVFNVGATPVLADVDSSSYNIDPDEVEKAITERTKAIIVVHLFGQSADMDPIREIAQKNDCYIIEDAACSLGATYKGKLTGTLGDIACFSFHPRKILTTGEGGMLVTDDVRIAQKAATLKDHGKKAINGKTYFVRSGNNYRLSDVLAAIGLAQLRKFDSMIQKRSAPCRKILRNATERRFWNYAHRQKHLGAGHTYQSFVTYVKPEFGLSRDDCIALMRNNFGVETQIGTYALHTQPAYSRGLAMGKSNLERSKNLYLNTLALPLYHTMSTEEQEYVVDSLKKLRK